jgi:abelson tyrosine-protein kinase 1
MSFFSDVYRGTWRSQTVTIKVLAPSTPKSLFVHEVEIWHELNHPNVLELFGASSASGDPPWFVSRFCGGGSLVKWLKGVEEVEWAAAVGGGGGGSGVKMSKKGRVDLLRMMHEIAKGMEYLHRAGVLHGDLKVFFWTVLEFGY